MHDPPSHLTLRLPGGQTVAFRADASRALVIGRNADCDVVADDPSVSGRHVELSVVTGGIALRDLGSRFGTHVNDRAVEQAVLTAGDTAWLGDVALVVPGTAPSPAEAPAPTDPAPRAHAHPSPAPGAPDTRRTSPPVDRFVLFAIAFAVIVLVAVAALFLLG